MTALAAWYESLTRESLEIRRKLFGKEHLDVAESLRNLSIVLVDRGKVVYHRDYWDTAEELYAKLPLLGGLMRFLRRRLQAPR